jgi:hypothetical protein|tara:strand:- start:1748 stop:1981 length:234 start_codon:yes stop_codon:yes gene_type:complete
MEYKYEDIEKVINFSTWSVKQKIDELFRIDCSMYCNLGTDSSRKDREDVKKKSRAIYKAIGKIDAPSGKFLQFHLDS